MSPLKPARDERRRCRVLPAVEPLANRLMLSVTALFAAAAGELRVTGDEQDNTIVVSRDAGGAILVNNGAVVIQGGIPTAANTSHLHIVGAGGNDNISLDETNGPFPGTALFGGDGNDTLTTGSGEDFIDGGAGSDTAFMGGGDDTFQWNPGNASDVVEGQAGHDALYFNGSDLSEKFDVVANGNRVRLTRDLGSVNMDLNGLEELHLNALGGADTVTVNDQTATGLLDVELDLEGAGGIGDGAADNVVVNASNADDGLQVASFDNASRVAVAGTTFPFFNIIGADATLDRLTVNALGGDDVVDAGSLAADSILLTLNGGEGNDELLAGGGNDLVTGGPGDDKAFLETGDDTFVWNAGDGNDTVEGQSGRDTLRFNGADVDEVVSITGEGARVRLARDVGNETIDLNEVERLDVNSLGGADTITVDLDTPVTLQVDSGSQHDLIEVRGTAASAVVTVVPSSGDDIVNVNMDGVGAARVSFDSTQRLGGLNVGSGGLATLTSGGAKVLSLTSLVLAGAGTFDLNDNDLILDYATPASPLPGVASLIRRARNGGAWDGSGLTSAFARNAPQHNTTLGLMEATEFKSMNGAAATFGGQAIDDTAVLVKFTYYGDTNFSGTVNFDDYVRTDVGFNTNASGWANGDFNLSGQVNFDDYVLIDLAFNTQSGTLSRA
jgi:Ca2+-binding RTX toxin-like protein